MKNIPQKKQKNNKNTIGSVVAGVAGAVAVAGVAVATMALKDEKTRKKVKKVLGDVRDQVIDYAEALKVEPNSEEEARTIKKTKADTKKDKIKNK